MPRDAWAEANAKDRGRKAIQTGEYETANTNLTPVIRCQRCKSSATVTRIQKYKNGQHLRCECAQCGRFIKFLKQ